MSAAVESYLRHAQKFGDPQSVYEAAESAVRDRELSAHDLGVLALRLPRVKINRDSAHHWVGEGRARRRVAWPAFRLSPAERDRLVYRLLVAGEQPGAIARMTGVPARQLDDYRAVLAMRQLLRDHGHPVDLSDGSELSRTLIRCLGPNPPIPAPDSLATSGITGEILTVGMRFGRLAVTGFARAADGRRIVLCRCDCGKTTSAKPSHLLRQEKRSCGCLRRERLEAMKGGVIGVAS